MSPQPDFSLALARAVNDWLIAEFLDSDERLRGSIVVPGTRTKTFPSGPYQLACALIIGRRSESTDLRTSLNAALREVDET